MGRRAIEIESFVRDVRAGNTGSDLRKKYGLSQKVLDEVISRLVKSGRLNSSDLVRESSQPFESTLVVATTCPRCGSLLWADSGECSNCLANRISQMIDDKEEATTEATEESVEIPEDQFTSDSDVATVVEQDDESVTEEESAFVDVVESVTPEPADTVDVPEQMAESVELEELKEVEEIGTHEIKKRRWPAIAAIAVFGVAACLVVLVYTGELELPGMFGTSPPPPAPVARPQPSAAAQKVSTPHSAPKHPDSVDGSLAPGKRRVPELQIAAVEEPTEPQDQREHRSGEGDGDKTPSSAQQTGPSPEITSPKEVLREPTPIPQAVLADKESSVPSSATPDQDVAALPAPPPDATRDALSSAPPAEKIGSEPATEDDLNTAIMNAVTEGRVERVMVLLGRGADANAVDTEGSPLLVIATKLGNESLVDLLLKRGADASIKDKSGLTALARASEEGNGRITELLLSRDKQRGSADLLEACEKGKTKMVKLMLDRGADINARGSDGGTPLMIAAGKGHLELVEALLSKGADATAQDNRGFTALAWAYSPTAMNVTPFRVQKEIIRLLKHHESRKVAVPAGRE